jgi:hypothetical protein
MTAFINQNNSKEKFLLPPLILDKFPIDLTEFQGKHLPEEFFPSVLPKAYLLELNFLKN